MAEIITLFVSVIITCFFVGVDGQTINDTKRLYDELFKTRNPNEGIIPVMNQSTPIQVTIDFALTQIADFHVTERDIVTSGYMTILWRDETSAWNPDDFGGVEYLYVKNGKLWQPHIIQYALKQSDRMNTVSINKDGTVLVVSAGEYVTHCGIDVFLYPFDKHECYFFFFTYENVNMTTMSSEMTLSTFTSNTEWEIDKTECSTGHYFYGKGLAWFDCNVYVSRRPMYGMFHVFLPAICLTILTILIFWLPVNCGERISYAITLFLAYTMTITGLSEEIPRDSTRLSLYSYVLVIMNMISALCVVFSVIVTRVSLSSRAEMPACLKCLVLFFNPSLRRQRKVKPTNNVTRLQSTEQDTKQTYHKNATVVDDGITWLAAAQAIDNVIFIVIVTTLLVILSIGLYHAIKNY